MLDLALVLYCDVTDPRQVLSIYIGERLLEWSSGESLVETSSRMNGSGNREVRG